MQEEKKKKNKKKKLVNYQNKVVEGGAIDINKLSIPSLESIRNALPVLIAVAVPGQLPHLDVLLPILDHLDQSLGVDIGERDGSSGAAVLDHASPPPRPTRIHPRRKTRESPSWPPCPPPLLLLGWEPLLLNE